MKTIDVTDYTGPAAASGFYRLTDLELDVQTYTLHSEHDADFMHNAFEEDSELGVPAFTTIRLPNVALKDAWSSLIFDDALPSRLLRYVVQGNIELVVFMVY